MRPRNPFTRLLIVKTLFTIHTQRGETRRASVCGHSLASGPASRRYMSPAGRCIPGLAAGKKIHVQLITVP